MKKFCQPAMYLVMLLLLHAGLANAQFRLKIIVRQAPIQHRNENFYVAGSFNSWNPAENKLLFDKDQQYWYTELRNFPKDVSEFKFTRGTWSNVQTSSSGTAVENNLVNLKSDSTLEFNIAAWGDDFISIPKTHSASPNVSIIDTAFYIPQLKTSRRIWAYLPPGYLHSRKKYPVLYMHDGQNLFDDLTSGYGEWGVDECLDSLLAQGKPPCIVIGIDNGPKRMNEYNPFVTERFGVGEGDAYLDFIAKTLKPFIDQHYRTIKTKENTMIAGSSMGGLISYYAMLKYPDVFGKAGIFSPSFWIAPAMKNYTDSMGGSMKGKFFFYAGGLEGDEMVTQMLQVSDSLGAHSGCSIYCVVDPAGRHNELAWRTWFPQFFLWAMAPGNNFVVDTDDKDP